MVEYCLDSFQLSLVLPIIRPSRIMVLTKGYFHLEEYHYCGNDNDHVHHGASDVEDDDGVAVGGDSNSGDDDVNNCPDNKFLHKPRRMAAGMFFCNSVYSHV